MELRGTEIPRCRDHAEKIMDCSPCQMRLRTFWANMPKATVRTYAGMTGRDFNSATDRVVEENQTRFHTWALANIYANPNELMKEPF